MLASISTKSLSACITFQNIPAEVSIRGKHTDRQTNRHMHNDCSLCLLVYGLLKQLFLKHQNLQAHGTCKVVCEHSPNAGMHEALQQMQPAVAHEYIQQQLPASNESGQTHNQR